MTQLLGFIAAIVSIISFGSSGVPLKSKPVARININPVIFHIYLLCGILCSGFFLYIYTPVQIDSYIVYAAIIQSLLFVPSNILAIMAVQSIGIVTAISVWAGLSMLVSFLWGIIIFPDINEVNNVAYCVIAIILLLVGIIIFVMAFKVENADNIKFNNKGIICAVIVGLLNGSLLVPFQWLSSLSEISINDFAFNVTVIFGVCNIPLGLIAVIISSVYMRCNEKWQACPQLHLKIGFPAGFITGVIWSVGNVSAVYATLFLGISRGMPLSQLALVINAVWGIVLFRELRSHLGIILWIGAVSCLLVGAFVLSDSLNEGIID